MKKITAILLVFIMMLTLVLPVFADDDKQVTSYFTVLWSEAGENGHVNFVIGQSVGNTTTLSLSRDGNIALSSDGSKQGDAFLKAVQNGERIHAGSVIALTWSGEIIESFPCYLPNITAVEFTNRDTNILQVDVQPALDSYNDFYGTDKYQLDEFEEFYFKIKTFCTVVGCRYDEANDYYELAVSSRRSIYAVYDNLYRWYYTTSNGGFYLNENRTVEVKSDGSVTGDKALELALKGEPVPLGTVVEIEWSGLIQETFPPSLVGIVSYTFTGKNTDYSYDDIISQMNSMNQMRSDEVKYPVPAESDVENCYYRAEYTVLKTTPASAPDYEEYGIYTPSMILIRKVGSGKYSDIIDIGVDANEMCVTRDNDLEAKGIYETYISNHEVPQGTVVEVTWSGATLESYPGYLEDVVEIKFTSKTSEYTAEELAKEEYDYDHAFDIIAEGSDNDGETVSSSSGGDYPAMIMHDNTVYELVGEAAVDVAEESLIGYTTSYTDGTPVHEGETNFSRQTGLKYASAELNGVRGIAVHYEGSWHFFKPVYDMAPVASAEENPKTGVSDVFAGIALAGILAWVAAVTSTKCK